MIRLEGLRGSNGFADVEDAPELIVKGGEVYSLLSRDVSVFDSFFDKLRGFSQRKDNDNIPAISWEGEVAFVENFSRLRDFDGEVTLIDFIEYCSEGKQESMDKVFEQLLWFEVFVDNLKKKIKRCETWELKAVIAAISVSGNEENIIINDMARGNGNLFEFRFTKLLEKLKSEGKAILYLTEDIFYAMHISDKLSFFKNSILMPKEPILSKHIKEMDMMTLYSRYLS